MSPFNDNERSPVPPDVVPPCNVLIVDDEPANLLAVEAILEPLPNVNLVRATSGIEALKQALKLEFCVVLLDVQMPEMDGLETASLLRKRPRTRELPIIFLTAISKDPSFVARGYDVGAVDYLFKPYDPDALRTKVTTFVELWRKNARIRVGKERELDDFKRWSERRYEDLANAVPQIVWTADASGELTYHNQRWNEIAQGELDFASIAHPDDLGSFAEGWSHAVRAGTPWEAELRLGSEARGYRHHLVRAIPRRDDSGKILTWVGSATDIDARVRADRSLRMLADASLRLNGSLEEPRDLEEMLRGALPILGDGAILEIIDAHGKKETRVRVATSNDKLPILDDPRLELGPATVVYSGRPEIYFDVAQEHDSARAMRDSERNPNPSERGSEHVRFLAELGVQSYVCVPLVTRGRSVGSLTLVRLARERFDQGDVDLANDLAARIAVAVDNARLHATTERRREELELANKSKDVFLATLSHELRTPLNAIVGWTDMMRKGTLEGAELTRAVETIDRNAHALSGLVADLLDVSRIVTGSLKIESKLTSLASVVEAAVLAAKPQCEAKAIRLELATADTAVRGDPGRLRQVVANLLSNAIKFTPHGGTISVRMEADAHARIVVADSGEGIAPDFLPHVFERFRQAEVGRAKGLGLGLAIVKHLVEVHGGTVVASSEGAGKGAVFTIELPRAEVPADAAVEDAAPTTTMQGEPKLNGLHVVIVEDDPDGNELVCTILERYGARVTSTSTAAAALDALEADPPQVLVSDIGLPDMDGMELIKEVRSRPALAAIPAVALTAYASRQDATKAIAAGFDAHVAKPVQPATLGGVIAKLLARAGLPASGTPGTSADASSAA